MKTYEEEIISAKFGSFIRESREEKGLYQADIAEQIGVSRSYYSLIEAGKRDIYFSLAVKICRTLELDARKLIECLKE